MTNDTAFRFLSQSQVHEIATNHDTPVYVYSERELLSAARQVVAFGGPFGFTPRYAMKANPHPRILRLFDESGLSIDASSEYEALAAIEVGVAPQKIVVNSQQMPRDVKSLIQKGVSFTATSLYQLEEFGRQCPGGDVSVRLNPGMGSGASNKLTTGGVGAAFGIWHEYIPKVLELAEKYDLTISKVHTHIGSGTNPEAWEAAAHLSLELVKHIPSATKINLGGGFKVARMADEPSADMNEISPYIHRLLEAFAEETGRRLHLEIEPGTLLVANAGSLIARIIDVTDTGEHGYHFLRVNTGMNDILRPSLYGSQHPLVVVPKLGRPQKGDRKYVIAGHCCESGDILTPAPGNPEQIEPRELQIAERGDLLVIEGAGAYCGGMRAKGYNSFPDAVEVFVD